MRKGGSRQIGSRPFHDLLSPKTLARSSCLSTSDFTSRDALCRPPAGRDSVRPLSLSPRFVDAVVVRSVSRLPSPHLRESPASRQGPLRWGGQGLPAVQPSSDGALRPHLVPPGENGSSKPDQRGGVDRRHPFSGYFSTSASGGWIAATTAQSQTAATAARRPHPLAQHLTGT